MYLDYTFSTYLLNLLNFNSFFFMKSMLFVIIFSEVFKYIQLHDDIFRCNKLKLLFEFIQKDFLSYIIVNIMISQLKAWWILKIHNIEFYYKCFWLHEDFMEDIFYSSKPCDIFEPYALCSNGYFFLHCVKFFQFKRFSLDAL